MFRLFRILRHHSLCLNLFVESDVVVIQLSYLFAYIADLPQHIFHSLLDGSIALSLWEGADGAELGSGCLKLQCDVVGVVLHDGSGMLTTSMGEFEVVSSHSGMLTSSMGEFEVVSSHRGVDQPLTATRNVCASAKGYSRAFQNVQYCAHSLFAALGWLKLSIP